jgi:hypothetical protein
MKRESLGWVVAGLIIVLVCTVGAMQQQQGQVGRYQLMTGRETIVGDASSTEQSHIYRIDTATGECWQYMSLVTKEKPVTGWLRLFDIPQQK